MPEMQSLLPDGNQIDFPADPVHGDDSVFVPALSRSIHARNSPGCVAMDEIKAILNKIVTVLSAVPGIQAIVLGGSRARGTHSPASDIDIGIYYDGTMLDIAALTKATQTVDDEHRENLIAPPGGWGEWANGGGWLSVEGYSVDFILRDVARVEKVIEEVQRGIVTSHYQVGHPHAYINVMYMGELAIDKVLWETGGHVSAMKRMAEQYPVELQKALIHLFSFEAEFSLWLAESSIDKDDSYYVTAHVVRSVSATNQVLFALNKKYCINEKKAVRMIDGFSIHPAGYKSKVDEIFAAVGTDAKKSCGQLRELVSEVKALLTAEQTEHVAATIDTISSCKDRAL